MRNNLNPFREISFWVSVDILMLKYANNNCIVHIALGILFFSRSFFFGLVLLFIAFNLLPTFFSFVRLILNFNDSLLFVANIKPVCICTLFFHFFFYFCSFIPWKVSLWKVESQCDRFFNRMNARFSRISTFR